MKTLSVERSPEKAGVGGSTPSLATIIPKDLATQAPLTACHSAAIVRYEKGSLSLQFMFIKVATGVSLGG